MRSFARNAVTEHLMAGKPISRIEAMNLYGMQDLTSCIGRMRKEGHEIIRTTNTLEKVVKRLQRVIKMSPPSKLPTKEMIVSEYRMVK